MKTKLNISEISRKASDIAGALWDDRSREVRELPISEQIIAVASGPSHGTDGDLTESDRVALRALATEAAK